jgi:hypothetical protein
MLNCALGFIPYEFMAYINLGIVVNDPFTNGWLNEWLDPAATSVPFPELTALT